MLLDVGPYPDAWLDNAGRLGVDLSTIELPSLSPWHADHWGGFPEVRRRGRQRPTESGLHTVAIKIRPIGEIFREPGRYPWGTDQQRSSSELDDSTESNQALANLAKALHSGDMTTMNVSLPDELKNFVDSQIQSGNYGSTSEYVRDLIRRDHDRRQLRAALLEGARSPITSNADAAYFASLRDRAQTGT